MIVLSRRECLVCAVSALAAAGCTTPASRAAEHAVATTPSGARIFVNAARAATLHSFVSAGIGVNTTVIELSDRLVIVDAQLDPAAARESRAYADSLGKRLDRLVLTHEHPDHWSGAVAYEGVPVVAPAATARFLTEAAPRMKTRPGVVVPRVERTVAAGEETVAAVLFRYDLVRDAEADEILTIELPEAGVFVGSDLVYNDVHHYLGHAGFARWIATNEAIANRLARGTLVLGGHGAPTTPAVLRRTADYLRRAQRAFDRTADAATIEADLKAAFPGHAAEHLLPLGIGRALAKAGTKS
jgi:glyoxylase-like metal-dependent hydrolase (beta-lactamase superfamily II)